MQGLPPPLPPLKINFYRIPQSEFLNRFQRDFPICCQKNSARACALNCFWAKIHRDVFGNFAFSFFSINCKNNDSPYNKWARWSTSFYRLQPIVFRFNKGTYFQWVLAVTTSPRYLGQCHNPSKISRGRKKPDTCAHFITKLNTNKKRY